MKTLRQEPSVVGKNPLERSVEELISYGVVPINKPAGPTSHETAAFVKKILGIKKAGHAGTLDANVCGVLVVLLENSCKAAGYLLKERKKYVCIMETKKEVSKEVLEKTFSEFRGKIIQTPPKESAVAKKPRVREIYELNLLEKKGRYVLFECESQAGTYIRTLCKDMGEKIGVEAWMKELRRVYASGFKEKQAITLQELSDYYWLWKEKGKSDLLRQAIVPIEKAIQLKKVVASDGALHSICSGANLAIPGVIALDEEIKKGEPVSVMTGKGELVAIARALLDSSEIEENEHGLAFDIERVIHFF